MYFHSDLHVMQAKRETRWGADPHLTLSPTATGSAGSGTLDHVRVPV
jgi:hypothetical protein